MSEEIPEQPDGASKNRNGGKVWHALESSEVVRALDTSPKLGLTSEEAARRLVECGPNELAEQPRSTLWQMIREQFNNFIIIILLIAALVSLMVLRAEVNVYSTISTSKS